MDVCVAGLDTSGRPGLEPGPIPRCTIDWVRWLTPFAPTTFGGYGSRLKAGTTNLLPRLQHRDVIRHRGATHVEDAGELWILQLHALGRLAGQLHRAHHMH